MKKWINEHPYILTSVVFLVIIVIGWQFLYWRWENFAFLLLLYFIVTLGIRLDDISKKITAIFAHSARSSKGSENIIKQLNDIRAVLINIDRALDRVLEKLDKENNLSEK
jgi:hypothetical protein